MGEVSNASRFILLDRDGVINQRIKNGYVTSWAQFEFLPGVLEALRILNEHRYSTIVVSNQACVAKGLISASDLDKLTRTFLAEVESHGGRIRAVYYCPHREEDACTCRKPQPGLLLKARSEFGLDFANTILIGDSDRDMLAAREVGCRAWLVSQHPPKPIPSATRFEKVFPSLRAAAGFLLGRGESP